MKIRIKPIRELKAIIRILKGKSTIKEEWRTRELVRKILGSHSQYAEDLFLAEFLGKKKDGFYIDIGAHHPKFLSNTKYFYKRGFRGINIEANPALIEEFLIQRNDEINLNIGIAEQEDEMDFYILSCPALGTFNKDEAVKFCKERGVEIKNTIKVKTLPLKKIMEQYVGDKVIDFMSVDAEGYDLEVLKSNDWSKYRPEFLVIETSENYDNILNFVSGINYEILYENGTNGIFKDTLKLG